MLRVALLSSFLRCRLHLRLPEQMSSASPRRVRATGAEASSLQTLAPRDEVLCRSSAPLAEIPGEV